MVLILLLLVLDALAWDTQKCSPVLESMEILIDRNNKETLLNCFCTSSYECSFDLKSIRANIYLPHNIEITQMAQTPEQLEEIEIHNQIDFLCSKVCMEERSHVKCYRQHFHIRYPVALPCVRLDNLDPLNCTAGSIEIRWDTDGGNITLPGTGLQVGICPAHAYYANRDYANENNRKYNVLLGLVSVLMVVVLLVTCALVIAREEPEGESRDVNRFMEKNRRQ